MATWQELSRDNLSAKKLLSESSTQGPLGEVYLRSCVSRTYYAAYCAATSLLVERDLSFARGWNNPPHEQVPDLIRDNTDISLSRKRRIRKNLSTLRTAREDADYRPGI